MLPLDLNSAPLGIGRHVSRVPDPFNGHIDAFRISHVQRSDRWIETTWNSMSDPGAFAVAGADEQFPTLRQSLRSALRMRLFEVSAWRTKAFRRGSEVADQASRRTQPAALPR